MAGSMRFVFGNTAFCVSSPRRAWAITKVMRQYIKDNPQCCVLPWRKAKIVHHVVPVHINPALAADPSNMRSICTEDVHRVVGHGGDYQRWNNAFDETCRAMRIIGGVSDKIDGEK